MPRVADDALLPRTLTPDRSVLAYELDRVHQERLLLLGEVGIGEDRLDHVGAVVLLGWRNTPSGPVEPAAWGAESGSQLVEPLRGWRANETSLDTREVGCAHPDSLFELMKGQPGAAAPVLQHITEGLGRAHRCITCRRIPPVQWPAATRGPRRTAPCRDSYEGVAS